MKRTPKSARDTNVTLGWRRTVKGCKIPTKHSDEKEHKSAWNTNVPRGWKGILRVRETLG